MSQKKSKRELHISNTFTVGVNPSSLAITPNGKFAYVTNSNNYAIPGSDTVSVLDLKKGRPKLTIADPSFDEPYRLAIDKHGKFAYVCNSGSPNKIGQQGTVSIIDIKTNTVVGLITGFDGPGGIVLSESTAYVTNYGADGGVQSGNGRTVSVVDLKTKKITDTITVSQAPSALILSPCEQFLYVVSYVDGLPGTGVLTTILLKTKKIISTLSGLFGPFGLVISQCGSYAYITNFGSNNFAPYGTTVSVVDLQKNQIVHNINVGIQPSGIEISPDGHYLYVSNYNALYAKSNFQNLTYGEGTVNVIRLKKHLEGGKKESPNVIAPTISVGQTPATLVISPDGKTLYVCKYVQNTVASISL